MRKLGFTLAEVLITLGIIGVIATLTLPTLMSNTAEREYATALKKATSALTEAVQMQVALENISFDEMVDPSDNWDDEDGTEVNSLYAFLCNRMQTEKFASDAAGACDDNIDSPSGTETGCLDYGSLMNGNYAMFFRDGSAVIWEPTATVEDDDCVDAMGEDVNCFKVVYDVNGFKKPNLLANCKGKEGRGKAPITDDDTTECSKENFVARDQYPLKLHGVGAYPNSPAARYMFNRK